MLVSFAGTVLIGCALYTSASVALLDALHHFVTTLTYRRLPYSQFWQHVNCTVLSVIRALLL